MGEGEQCKRGRKERGGEKGVRKKMRQKDVCEERRGEEKGRDRRSGVQDEGMRVG